MRNRMQIREMQENSAPLVFWWGARFLAAAVLAAATFSYTAWAAGEDTYKAKCAGCHGPDGAGATPLGKKFKLRDLRSGDVQNLSDAELQNIIAKGKPPMPAFEKTLDAVKIQELVSYIRSIKH